MLDSSLVQFPGLKDLSIKAMQAEAWSNSGWLSGSAVICALLLILSWVLIMTRRRHMKLPPGPLPLPVVGNMFHFIGDLPHVRLARLAEKHGPLMTLRLGSALTVVASSAEVARAFLQTHDKVFASRPTNEFTERAHFGQANSISLAVYGAPWRHIRKVAALELFSPRRVQETQALRREEVARLLHSLRAQADVSASLDLARAMSGMVEDILCRIIFGRRMSDMAVPGGDTLKYLVVRTTELFQAPVVGDFIPWLGFLDRGVKRSMDALNAGFDALWECLIQEREKQHELNTLQGGKNVPEDVFDVLLLDPSLNRRRIKGYLLDFLAAGIDTTSAALDWIMAELLNNPSTFNKLRLQIEGVVGRERIVDESDMADLPYVTATVKEGLRMHAPVSLMLPHMSIEACNVMGYNLPKGTTLFVNAWAIGRDPATWKDPERFWPERFLLTKGDVDPNQQLWWIPFGSGRRSCPGAPLAFPTLELTVANLVHCFDWRLPEGQTHVDMSAKTSLVVCRKQPLLATPIVRINGVP